jgi:hypothetical protein
MSVETIASWGIIDRKGRLIQEDKYPLLCRSKAMAQHWCDKRAGEKPIRVYLTYEPSEDCDAPT